MFELIKKSLLASLGAAVVTKEKIEQITRKLVDEGKISMDEAEKLSGDLLESGKKQWDELQAKVSVAVKKALENLDIVSREDFLELTLKVEDLEKRLAAIEETHQPDQG
jgi:polyhydroxyalkanoate synthesis regulator phasin